MGIPRPFHTLHQRVFSGLLKYILGEVDQLFGFVTTHMYFKDYKSERLTKPLFLIMEMRELILRVVDSILESTGYS